MVNASTWRWRQPELVERFWCRRCRMEMFVMFEPPEGKDQVYGPALQVNCTFNPSKDAIVNNYQEENLEN